LLQVFFIYIKIHALYPFPGEVCENIYECDPYMDRRWWKIYNFNKIPEIFPLALL
jgi:hypothetical protein